MTSDQLSECLDSLTKSVSLLTEHVERDKLLQESYQAIQSEVSPIKVNEIIMNDPLVGQDQMEVSKEGENGSGCGGPNSMAPRSDVHQRAQSSESCLIGSSPSQHTENCAVVRSNSSKGRLFTFVENISISSNKKRPKVASTVMVNQGNEQIIDPDRETWDKKIEFLLAVIGFAVDLGNVWRFPFVCYRNGGGAFLIPYMIMLIFGGLPLFYLELALGQYYRSGCLRLWQHICPIMKGIGFGMCVIDLYMGMYYNTIISWAVYYLMASFENPLPWTSCNNTWNTENCLLLQSRAHSPSNNSVSPAEEFLKRNVLQFSESSGIDDLGPIKGSLALYLGIVFILVYLSLWKGVKSAGKAVWITATMPYIVLTLFLIRSVTLDGSSDGIKYYLYPQWDKLLEIEVWVEAATQIFFSLGPGFGVLLALSSYNRFHNNCFSDAIFTSIINCATSLLSGFVTFAVLGYMAKMLNKEVKDVLEGNNGLVFIVYAEVIANMSYSPFWAVLFFIMLITLGLDSTFGGLEAILTGLCDEYPETLRKYRELFVGIVVIFIFIFALPTTTYGGSYVIHWLESYGIVIPLLFIVFIESVAICWLYGANKFAHQIQEMLGFMPGFFWRSCWVYICPVLLFAMFTFSLYQYQDLKLEVKKGQFYEYPPWSIALGWLITSLPMACVPIYAIFHLFTKVDGSFTERCIKSIKPQPMNSNPKEVIGQQPAEWENYSEV
ncbi:sodium-dependent serotonin transporter-like [Brevipalpus obovatus]|uniref:sodium-dependent serotonin transporter-like n=1 Tax=Brevipalpus obovatus TaxID=246614 RepID=UPI003D9E4AE6